MRESPSRIFASFPLLIIAALALPQPGAAQQQAGPQAPPPPGVTAQGTASGQPSTKPASSPSDMVKIPAGTRVAVVLENGISSRAAKAGDSVYFHTSFPITQNNRILVPVGSYIRGELVEAKRSGKVKGRGEFRMRLDTLIFPNGYTVNLNAVPRSADSGGKTTMDSEGKVNAPGGGGQDAKTEVETTATGAGIGAIAAGAKGAGIGAGIGGLAGLGAILLTRGPEAELPRGSTLDLVLDRDLSLDGNQLQFANVGQAQPITPPPGRDRY